ncbi:MAG: hypothetical protein KJN77_03595 [Gammaproteobacteria bacterium]|nr:hypothetical protein [Gammaproteobacteria bacterium]
MSYSAGLLLLRLLPVALITVAAALWFGDVQQQGQYLARNLVPLGVLLLLSGLTLHRGRGRWSGNGLCMPLGTLGFAIPALGLSLYLHYAYAVNLDDMFTDAVYPDRVFRYLPLYTLVAGGIGFAIGWIVGRNA